MKKFFIFLTLIYIPCCSSAATCRNPSIKHQFDVINGYPQGRKGYIVDHVCALACGGKDTLNNLQYQTLSEAKKKDKWERTKEGCSKTCNSSNSLTFRTVFNCK